MEGGPGQQVGQPRNQGPVDLIGGPFAVIESDPGVFTSLVRGLGVMGVEFIEVYGIEPWAMDHLEPYGLVLCFLWRKDSHRPADFDDPAAEKLSDDSCATHAILNVLLNCPGIDVGPELEAFKLETEEMSPLMRGLSVTNIPLLRETHNALARPADKRAAMSSLAINTFNAQKKKQKEEAESSRPRPTKRQKVEEKATKKGKEKAKGSPSAEDSEEGFHFIGYIPAHGKVWELDGFKSGPLEVGELPCSSTSQDLNLPERKKAMKMERYGGSGEDGGDIRFNLLALVDDGYIKASDQYLYLKQEKDCLEKHMPHGWDSQVDRSLLASAAADGPLSGLELLKHRDFAARRMKRDMEIMQMQKEELAPAWEACVRSLMSATVAVEDEIAKGSSANTDHIKRTFDYEPFLSRFISHLHSEGLLRPLLDLDENGKKQKATGTGKKG
ncbi:cysteine proteinase [Coprinellus micaceus]|uniref:ubiquitinyl hydrolase 1 n=1 Tax=Coprinellus micaceus TaxID=71717 RepID=A0A4Y7SBD7_COPMI|nr:cysteine proteinase [Coprinellus micaceus]